jgi:DNA invertase Pin-like site-specific DNA recombinase
MEDKKLDLAVATMPTATKFQLHIYAALAEEEREFISIRTKNALAEAKARGVKLGGNRPNNQARHRAVKAMADQNALVVSQIIKDHRQAGKTYRYIAQQMNDLNISTAKNGKWYASTVRNYDLRITA